jgi:hypothetical protein
VYLRQDLLERHRGSSPNATASTACLAGWLAERWCPFNVGEPPGRIYAPLKEEQGYLG